MLMHGLRAYHAALALLAFAAYLTSEAGIIHAWLGYGVVTVIVIRLLMALSQKPVLGLAKFYPRFKGLRPGNLHTHPAVGRSLLFGIALCLVGVTATGILMDKGHALGISGQETIQTAYAETEGHQPPREHRHERDHEEGAVEEIHETFGNALMFLVAAHIGYVLLFKLPMARFMLFMTPTKRAANRDT
ncbi:cytochrome b/b6 domain-containing protein [Kordiimonas marina]|uniref:cytochrome b/b6 domain-containing protein n=1 Tax=Kordiimonas marina TaxID=2872312 RepID=UPI001FF54D6C|nr:cytochrome b/b6 domain-containing protein [Kordiimonas marina]MCJ9428118.1 cytochrome b/b6 domain-containing protein [Kordiimonas marina]